MSAAAISWGSWAYGSDQPWLGCCQSEEGHMISHQTQGKRVRVYIGERDRGHGQHDPLWETLLHLLRDEGAAGATMFRGLAGFGAHSKIHTARLADLVPDLPVVVEWVDSADQVDRLLPRIDALVAHGTITVETVEIVRYSPHA